jgi:hypothetical protein
MLAGFILGGRMLPNPNVGGAIPMGMEPGVPHGYVSGSGRLPTIGATVMTPQQGDDFYASTFVSVNGQYYMNPQPGEYIAYVPFPDGSSKVVASELQIEGGATHELDISY